MSDRGSFDLFLGPGKRYIVEQGESAETALPDYDLSAIKGVRRQIEFRDCKIRKKNNSDVDLGDETFTVWIVEQSPDVRPYPEPWKLGAITTSPSQAFFYLLPRMFEQFWELAEASENSAVVHVEGHREVAILFVFEIGMEVRPRQHPSVAASLINWFSRHFWS